MRDDKNADDRWRSMRFLKARWCEGCGEKSDYGLSRIKPILDIYTELEY